MAFSSRGMAIGGGALLGAYTSDITDNPLTGAISTGIGAVMGSMMILPERNIKQMADVVTGVQQDTTYIAQRAVSNISKENEERVSKFRRQLDTFKALTKSTDQKDINLVGKYATNSDHIQQILRNNLIQVDDYAANPQKFIEALEQINDPRLIKKLTPLLSGDSFKAVDLTAIKAPHVKEFEDLIRNNLTEQDKVKQLTEVFTKQMGNSLEEATEKAKLFVSRAAGPIEIEAGKITFGDKVDNGRRVTIPITAYDTNGVRYHDAGNGKANSVKGFTPYMLDLVRTDGNIIENGITKKIGIEDVKKGMAPEMMLKFLDKDTPIAKVLDNIKSHFEYDSFETGADLMKNGRFTATSASFINNSSQVKYDMIRNLDHSDNLQGKSPFRKMTSVASGAVGAVSEESLVRDYLARTGKNASAGALGVSNNTTTTLQTKEMSTISMFPPLERNVSGSVLRDTIPLNKTVGASIVQDVFEDRGSKLLYASSQVFNKLDVRDADAFNSMSAALLGDNSKVLADGFGLYNRGHDTILANKSMADIVLPRDTNTIIKDSVLYEALASGNINEYIKSNGPIEIGNGVLGYDREGKAIQLNQQYSSGSIVNSFINKQNDIVLQTAAEFNPNKENLVKIFSVGSKSLASGVEADDFNLLTALGSLMNEDKVRFSDTGLDIVDKNIRSVLGKSKLTIQEMKDLKKNNNFMSQFGRTDITLITDSSQTGDKDIQRLLEGKRAVDQDVLEKSGVNKLIAKTKDRTSSIIAGYLTMESKGAGDITAHLTTSLMAPLKQLQMNRRISKPQEKVLRELSSSGLIDKEFMTKYTAGSAMGRTDLLNESIAKVTSAFRTILDPRKHIDAGTKDNALFNLYKLVSMSGISKDITSGFSTAIGSTNKGSSIVGAGGAARMSWNANMQLRTSGFERNQLEWFGKTNKEMVYELEGIMGENSKSTKSINHFIDAGRERELESILSNNIPEGRTKKLQSAFTNFKNDSAYLSYNLNFDGGPIKSLNFGVMSTNRGGKYEFKDTELIKELDKKRLNILALDIDLSRAEKERRKEIEVELKAAMEEYHSYKRSLFSGENNLLKNASSLYSDTSAIMIAQPIGGDAKALTEFIEREADGSYKAISNKTFVSQEGLDQVAAKLNIKKADIEYRDVEGTSSGSSLRAAGYRDSNKEWVPFSALVTREPAQGTLSTQFMDLVVDTSIKGSKDSLHFSQGQFGWSVGQTGDFDQDTIQTMYSKLTRSQYDSLDKTASTVREREKPYLNYENEMSPKGGERAMRHLGSFDSLSQFEEYKTIADAKGKARKTFSPLATTMALNYMQALDTEFAGDPQKLTLGRIATYRSIENLLKSSHKDTASFMRESQDIEKLSIARDIFVKNNGLEKDYKKAMYELLPNILGHEGTDSNKDKTVMAAVDLITEAELKHAKRVSSSVTNPTEVLRVAKGVKGLDQALYEAMDSMDMFNLNRGVDVSRSPQQLYRGVNDAIVEATKKNKGLFMTGAAALVGINLLGRSEPSFTDSRSNMRQHSTQMLQTPTDLESVSTQMPTSRQSSNYVQPKTYTSKSVDVQGDFVNQEYNNYNQFNSTLDDGYSSTISSMNNAIFGRDLRTARLDLSDL